jgi:putative ABC transport system permease protein
MHIQETFRTAIKALTTNKVRTILTMLGVIIGVFAVVTLIASVKGFENYVEDQFNAIGTNLLYVLPGKMSLSEDPYKALSANKLQQDHVDLVEKYAGDYISHISGYHRLAKTAKYKTNKYTVYIEGMNAETDIIWDLEISKGEFYDEADVLNKERVTVISNLVAEELFTNKDPIGEMIKIENETYRVIGVFDYEIIDFRNSAFIPQTVVKDDFEMKKLQGMVIKAKSESHLDEAATQIELALLHELKEEDFTVWNQNDMLEAFQNILNIISIGLAAIAGISLLVGGIGIMNIMLVSVTERTREIGLRKAIGATSLNIGQQFVLESVAISLVGGLIGLFISWLATLAAKSFVRVEIPMWAVFLAIGFSVAVGVGFGTWPALKASKKDPIEALRFE